MVITPCFSTTASRAAFQSSAVRGLFAPCVLKASQSLGTMQGNSQQPRPISVPVPPSLFGQLSQTQIGALQSGEIDLIAAL